MVGDEKIKNLPFLLSKLKAVMLRVPKSKVAQRSVLSSLAEGYKENQANFLCARAKFANAITLIDLCSSIAAKPIPPPHPLLDLQLVHTKLDTISEKQKSNALPVPQPMTARPSPPSFADIAKRGAEQPTPTQGAQTRNPTSLPPKIPSIVLKQAIPSAPVELKTGAEVLSAKINSALKKACQLAEQPCFKIRATSVNHSSGEILIHLHKAEEAAFAADGQLLWLPLVNPGLRLKVKTYPIIVHGIPTSFDITRNPAVAEFQNDNPEAMSSLQSLNWANQVSIREGKPFSSLIIHLSDPNEANLAIQNKIAFQSVLKLAEISTRRVVQCYSCMAFGHLAAKCSAKLGRCSHCAQNRRSEVCPLNDLPASCANCLDMVVEEGQKTEPAFNADSITDEDFVAISHSSLSNRCPLRQQASKSMNLPSYYPAHDAEK